MDFVQIMASTCDDIVGILTIVKLVIKGICWVVPIILIVLTILDIAKIVTAGNIDDKLKKEVMNKVTTRLIFALLIFLVPTIVTLLFNILGNTSAVIGDQVGSSNVIGCTWNEAWNRA